MQQDPPTPEQQPLPEVPSPPGDDTSELVDDMEERVFTGGTRASGDSDEPDPEGEQAKAAKDEQDAERSQGR